VWCACLLPSSSVAITQVFGDVSNHTWGWLVLQPNYAIQGCQFPLKLFSYLRFFIWIMHRVYILHPSVFLRFLTHPPPLLTQLKALSTALDRETFYAVFTTNTSPNQRGKFMPKIKYWAPSREANDFWQHFSSNVYWLIQHFSTFFLSIFVYCIHCDWQQTESAKPIAQSRHAVVRLAAEFPAHHSIPAD